MDERIQLEALGQHPDFRRLVAKKTVLTWSLTIVMLIAFYGFMALVAFWPATLAAPIGTSSIPTGIPVAIGVILLAFVLTAVYVANANGSIEALNDKIVKEHRV
jgi:uncharacterized membrane protein (DUF485 family)